MDDFLPFPISIFHLFHFFPERYIIYVCWWGMVVTLSVHTYCWRQLPTWGTRVRKTLLKLYLSIHPSVHQSIHPSLPPSIYPSIHPFFLLVFTIVVLCVSDLLSPPLSDEEIVSHYIEAAQKGISKVMAKMGISTLHSYKVLHALRLCSGTPYMEHAPLCSTNNARSWL